MISSKRRPFTLLELLIVILLLAMIGGVFGLSIQTLVRKQRFNNEANAILDRLRLAQDIMLLLDTDIKVIFTENEGQIKYRIKSEQNIKGNWNKLLMRPSTPLKVIKTVSLEDPLVPPLTQEPLEIYFYSKGTVMTRGILRLSNGSEDLYINLSGMPKPLMLATTPDRTLIDQDAEQRTNESLTQDTSLLIQEAIKGNKDDAPKT